jgi:CarD family transcriptional regulator
VFEQGESLLHPDHGAGVLAGIQTIEIGGVERRYYHIDLLNGAGTLMVPVDRADEAGLCAVSSAVGAPDEIFQALITDPETLADDYQVRQSELTDRIQSGDPVQMAGALRDLVWREQDTRLSTVDSALKGRAETQLASVLALQLDVDIESAIKRVNAVLQDALNSHESAGEAGV